MRLALALATWAGGRDPGRPPRQLGFRPGAQPVRGRRLRPDVGVTRTSTRRETLRRFEDGSATIEEEPRPPAAGASEVAGASEPNRGR